LQPAAPDLRVHAAWHVCRYGFNPGSALAIIGYGPVAALAAITTTLAAAAGTLSAMFTILALEWLRTKHVMWDVIGSSNGTLAGLVAITAGCSVVEVRGRARSLCIGAEVALSRSRGLLSSIGSVCSELSTWGSAHVRLAARRAHHGTQPLA
jgi:Ammonium Transporter Family